LRVINPEYPQTFFQSKCSRDFSEMITPESVAEHRSKRLTEEIIGSADLIPMIRRQERKILVSFPGAKGKRRLLRSFDPSSDHPGVKDPREPVWEKMEKVYNAIYPDVLGLIRELYRLPALCWRNYLVDLISILSRPGQAGGEWFRENFNGTEKLKAWRWDYNERPAPW
jgi:hypothetical protein